MIDMEIRLSPLGHTWIIDIDGTIFLHNSHLSGKDRILSGVKEFFSSIPEKDRIILLTAREEKYKDITIAALEYYGLRYDDLLFNMPTGERVLINDMKPSGLQTAIAFNIQRDMGIEYQCVIDENM